VAEEDAGDDLVRATAEIVRPLVKRLLAANVPFGRVESRLRELFVEIAEQEFALAHRPQTDSRIALLTGINRKEVRRIRSADATAPAPTKFGRNHAASLVSRWSSDPQALDASGSPRPIPYQAARGPSFVKLARDVAADLPPRAILDELLRTGAVRQDDDGGVVLVADAYVPVRGRSEKVAMLGEDPAQLIETMLHNIFAGDGAGDTLLQRKIFFDNIGAEAEQRVRADVRRAAETFLRSMDRLLARYDRDRNPKAPAGARRGAGIGVYFFETDSARGAAAGRARGRARGRTTAPRAKRKPRS
jgi:hypothetical protein